MSTLALFAFATILNHAGGQNVDIQVTFPKHKAYSGGFPTNYSAFVTSDQPAAVSVTNKSW
jgi:hypothetical protein